MMIDPNEFEIKRPRTPAECVLDDNDWLNSAIASRLSELNESMTAFSYIRELRRKKLISEVTFNSVLSAMKKKNEMLTQEVQKFNERLNND